MSIYSITTLERGYRALRYEPQLSDNMGNCNIDLGRKLLDDRNIRYFWDIYWDWDRDKKQLYITRTASELDFSVAERLVNEAQDKVTALMTWAMVHQRLLSILTAGQLP